MTGLRPANASRPRNTLRARSPFRDVPHGQGQAFSSSRHAEKAKGGPYVVCASPGGTHVLWAIPGLSVGG